MKKAIYHPDGSVRYEEAPERAPRPKQEPKSKQQDDRIGKLETEVKQLRKALEEIQRALNPKPEVAEQ